MGDSSTSSPVLTRKPLLDNIREVKSIHCGAVSPCQSPSLRQTAIEALAQAIAYRLWGQVSGSEINPTVDR